MTTNLKTSAPNSFMAVLQRKETQVGTLSEASTLLAAAVKAAALTGKRAVVTLKLAVEPKQGALHFSTTLSSALPKAPEPLCIFYADEHGDLHRNDPAQREFKMESVEGGLKPTATQEEAKQANAS